MKRRWNINQEKGVDIPMTPIIDIVFLLLIYFMLASNFITEQQFVVNLPESSQGDTRVQGPLVVIVTSSGKMMIDNREVDEHRLFNMLVKLPSNIKDQGLEIRAERTVPIQQIVSLLDIAKRAGIRHLRITTQQQGHPG